MLPGIDEDPYASGDPARTMIVRGGVDAPTAIVPRIRPPAQGSPAHRGALRSLLPWMGFGLVAVVIVVGAVIWAATLRGPQAPAAVLGESPAPAAPPVPATPAAAAPAPLAQPVPAAPRTVPPARRTVPRPKPAAPVVPPPVVAPVPTSAAPTTTPAAGWQGWWCADAAAAAVDPSCKKATPTTEEDAP